MSAAKRPPWRPPQPYELEPDDVIEKLRALRETVRNQRKHYDRLSRRKLPRHRSPDVRATALTEGEGVYEPTPDGIGMMRESTIVERSEWAVLSMRGVRQPQLDAVVRRLRLNAMTAGDYELVLMTVPYYSLQVGSLETPTVQQMFVERAMMHATARQLGRFLDEDNCDDHESRHRGEVEIDRAMDRMLARGASPPADAGYVHLHTV